MELPVRIKPTMVYQGKGYTAYDRAGRNLRFTIEHMVDTNKVRPLSDMGLHYTLKFHTDYIKVCPTYMIPITSSSSYNKHQGRLIHEIQVDSAIYDDFRGSYANMMPSKGIDPTKRIRDNGILEIISLRAINKQSRFKTVSCTLIPKPVWTPEELNTHVSQLAEYHQHAYADLLTKIAAYATEYINELLVGIEDIPKSYSAFFQ